MKLLLSVSLALASLPSCAFVVEKSTRTDPHKSHHADATALGPYSAAVEAGSIVFVSGKLGRRGEGFDVEAHTAIDAVELELRRLGLSLRDVVTATVYLTDMDRYAEFNAIYSARFPQPYPARVCVAVAALPAGAQVELQVVACRS